jgi:transposase-like protein
MRQVKFCPKCTSENISVEINVADSHDYCADCGFNFSRNGPVTLVSFPVKEKLVNEEDKDDEGEKE